MKWALMMLSCVPAMYGDIQVSNCQKKELAAYQTELSCHQNRPQDRGCGTYSSESFFCEQEEKKTDLIISGDCPDFSCLPEKETTITPAMYAKGSCSASNVDLSHGEKVIFLEGGSLINCKLTSAEIVIDSKKTGAIIDSLFTENTSFIVDGERYRTPYTITKKLEWLRKHSKFIIEDVGIQQ